MAVYLILSNQEIQEIAGMYGLTVVSHKPIAPGQGNTNYLLKTPQRKFVLTIFEIPAERAVTLCNILTLLAAHDFETTRIQYLPDGSALTSFKDKAVLLKPYIAGTNQKHLNVYQIKQLGTAISQLHLIPVPTYLDNKHYYELETLPAVLKSERSSDYFDWLVERKKAIKDLIPSGLPRALVHGDVFFDNVLFDGEEFAAIIDFEDACCHFRVFDLGMTIIGSCRRNQRIDMKKAQALLAGYELLNPLLPVEKKSLQLFIEYTALLTSTWRFWRYNLRSPHNEKSALYLEMVELAKQVQEMSEADFLSAVFI